MVRQKVGPSRSSQDVRLGRRNQFAALPRSFAGRSFCLAGRQVEDHPETGKKVQPLA